MKMSFRSVLLPAPDGPVRKVNEAGSSVKRDIAQDLGPRAVPHADIFEANHFARLSRRIGEVAESQ